MTCTCSVPHKVTILIAKEEVNVCSKRLGGCGEEIKENVNIKTNEDDYIVRFDDEDNYGWRF